MVIFKKRVGNKPDRILIKTGSTTETIPVSHLRSALIYTTETFDGWDRYCLTVKCITNKKKKQYTVTIQYGSDYDKACDDLEALEDYL